MCGEILSLSPPTSLPPSPFILDDRPALPFKIFLHPEIHINIYFYLYPPHFNRFSQRHEKGVLSHDPALGREHPWAVSSQSVLCCSSDSMFCIGVPKITITFLRFSFWQRETHTHRESVCACLCERQAFQSPNHGPLFGTISVAYASVSMSVSVSAGRREQGGSYS